MNKPRQWAPVGGAGAWLSAALMLTPFGALVGIVLLFQSVVGVLAGTAAFFIAAHGAALLRRGLAARLAWASWGSYVNPGDAGEPAFSTIKPAGIHILRWNEAGMGGPSVSDWILGDGAEISSVMHGLETSPDGRFVAALTMAAGAELVVYDTVDHVRYEYDHPNASGIFNQLFRNVIDTNSSAPGARPHTVLDEVLGKARRELYFSCHGLWLPESSRASCPSRLLTRDLSPGIKLAALLVAPDNLRTMPEPWTVIRAPLRRLSLNGQPTAYWCRDLEQAMLADDGKASWSPVS